MNGLPDADLAAAAERIAPHWETFRQSRLFITGGTGFLGQWLLALLLYANAQHALGLSIVCLTRNAARFKNTYPDLVGHVSLIEGYIHRFTFPEGHFTHVIHGATDTSAEADANPLELLNTITDGTQHALDFARQAKATKFLFLSSGAIYGEQPETLERLTESYAHAPDTLAYAHGKRVAENLCLRCGIESVIARGFTFSGPGMNMSGHFAIGNFIRDAVDGRDIRIKNDGKVWRSYLYAADAAAWMLAMLAAGRSGEAYNLGSDRVVSIGELAQRVAALIPSASGIVIEGKPGTGRIRYVPDIGKARTQLGLDVWTNLDSQILRTAEWYRTWR